MKAFVYEKKDSKKIAEILDVVNVIHDLEEGRIYIVNDKKRIFQYDTKNVKTTIYQN